MMSTKTDARRFDVTICYCLRQAFVSLCQVPQREGWMKSQIVLRCGATSIVLTKKSITDKLL